MKHWVEILENSDLEQHYVVLVLSYESHKEYYTTSPEIAVRMLEMCPYLDPLPKSARILWGRILDNWSY